MPIILVLVTVFLVAPALLIAAALLLGQFPRLREMLWRGLPIALIAAILVLPVFALILSFNDGNNAIAWAGLIVVSFTAFVLTLGVSVLMQSQRCRAFIGTALPYVLGTLAVGLLFIVMMRFAMTPRFESASQMGVGSNIAFSFGFGELVILALVFGGIAMLSNHEFRRLLMSFVPFGLVILLLLVPFTFLFLFAGVSRVEQSAVVPVVPPHPPAIVRVERATVHGGEPQVAWEVETEAADENTPENWTAEAEPSEEVAASAVASAVASDSGGETGTDGDFKIDVAESASDPNYRWFRRDSFNFKKFVLPLITVSMCCLIFVRVSSWYD